MAPSDEGAVSGADWGRDFRKTYVFSPSGPAGHLPHQREAYMAPSDEGLSAELTGGETSGRLAIFSPSGPAGHLPHQREAFLRLWSRIKAAAARAEKTAALIIMSSMGRLSPVWAVTAGSTALYFTNR